MAGIGKELVLILVITLFTHFKYALFKYSEFVFSVMILIRNFSNEVFVVELIEAKLYHNQTFKMLSFYDIIICEIIFKKNCI